LAFPINLTGLFVKNHGFIFFRRKRSIRCTVLPIALTANATVTSVPLSPDVIASTYLVPLTTKILDGLWIVVTPVLSTLRILCGSNLKDHIVYINFQKMI